MNKSVRMIVNGAECSSAVEPRVVLAYFLRDLGFTSVHIGCDSSGCGACTVILDGDRAVKSCTMFAVQADGREVTTVEGLAQGGKLHPLQEAFRDQHGLQCGFCTPGMILAALALLRRNPQPSEAEIRQGLSGNLCRCTGYQNIVKAVAQAATALSATPAATR